MRLLKTLAAAAVLAAAPFTATHAPLGLLGLGPMGLAFRRKRLAA